MLNVSYLFLEHVIGWPPALLIAFASGMFTFGQNISSLIQIYGSSSSLVPVVAVVLFRAVIPMIVCAVTGNWLSHRLEHR
ncbi:hypothetical protein BDP27DRAFT_1331962 [Rhodocollybia butyracea]|uniref:Uncharacterized protein n=1 Tax=Rhodocollybia butyracea TaxID=206335 RepID=A0A9P5PLD6_9AGAR|nr:hypothetical protein BDP27DRAFT_1331962 [Rhodocollybia butyracea]